MSTPLVFDEAWLKDYTRRTGKTVQGERGGRPSSVRCADTFPSGKARRTKYGNIRTETEDGSFDSKHEAREFEKLKLLARAGEIRAIARQVTFYLPGGVKYLADFVVWRADGKIEVMDAKSEATKKDKVYRIKKRLMLDTFGIEIEEV